MNSKAPRLQGRLDVCEGPREGRRQAARGVDLRGLEILQRALHGLRGSAFQAINYILNLYHQLVCN